MSVPPHVLAASLAALGLHDPAVPVAHLVADSLTDDVTLDEGADRLLVFEAERVTADVDVVFLAGRRRLLVHLEPEDYTVAALLQPGNEIQRPVRDPDADLRDVAPGLTSLVLRRRDGGDPHRTAWVVI